MVTGYFAPPRTGKTLLLSTIALKAIDKGIPVFTNYYLKGAYRINVEELSKTIPPVGSLIILDEVTAEADNRDFKSVPKGFIQYIVQHGHYCHNIIWASQFFDGVDKKLRNLTVDLFKIRPFINIPVKGKKRSKRPWLIRCTRYRPQVDYDRITRTLTDIHYTPLPGLIGFISKLLKPFYWTEYKVIPKRTLGAYDTHEDLLGRATTELITW